MGRATAIFLAPPPGALGRDLRVKYHLISITKSISKIFIPNFVCVLTNERYKTHQTRFSHSVALVMPHGGGTLGRWGPRGSKMFFSNMVMLHIKSTGVASRTECK